MDYHNLAAEVLDKTGAMMKSGFWPNKAHAFIHGEMFILNYMTFHANEVLPSELSAAMKTSSARVAMALKSLEAKGCVKRRIDTKDRRKVIVSITKLGKKLVETERNNMRSMIEKIIMELGEQDTKEYIRIIGRMTEIAKRINEVG